MMIRDELKKYRDIFAGEIRDHILPYWIKNVLDPDRRDWFGEVDLEGRPIKEADKGCVLITRILWTFSAAARGFEDEYYLDLARATYEIVETQFADRDHRGYFMSVSAGGQPVDAGSEPAAAVESPGTGGSGHGFAEPCGSPGRTS